ncbi:MAG: methyltransferase domain-containing protein [Candidatus Delongbacteria bacterium]|jgi:tellurite methyltransferase|nr:methyltransferase domain-containing protein [Candidatus Delongbacteria bacterium]
MFNQYDEKYATKEFYWGKKPSPICYKVLDLLPPDKPLKLLDIGCGEGRNSIFFARNGYHVTAFDLSSAGVDKTNLLAEEAGVKINTFVANLNEFRLEENFDILFSTGTLHYIPENIRKELFQNYKEHTNENGLHVFSVFVKKPFIKPAPDGESTAQKWISGELMNFYHDWKIEHSIEEIFDCMSSGIPHKHVSNRIIARKFRGEL